MGERRKARRYEVYLPVQVCMSKQRPLEYHTGQLRDVSRTGIFFHSQVPIDSGTGLELTFSLPAERDRGTSVLVRASAKTIRASQLAGEVTPVYGVAAAIDRIDFRPTRSFHRSVISLDRGSSWGPLFYSSPSPSELDSRSSRVPHPITMSHRASPLSRH